MDEAPIDVDDTCVLMKDAPQEARFAHDSHRTRCTIRLEWIGACAGFFTTTAFLPQVYRMYTSETAPEISVGMYCLFSIGVGLWIVYGIMKRAHSLVFTNCLTLGLALLILLRPILL